jgi:hypothetical protein
MDDQTETILAAPLDRPLASCCAPAEQATCCDPSDKADCCDDDPAAVSCGCQ